MTTNYNSKYEPKTYFVEDKAVEIIDRIKGTRRKEIALEFYNAGQFEELEPQFKLSALSEEDREKIGRLHPSFMGGEFLPDFESYEVEIARIILKSTTGDVVSIRAQRGFRIGYRMLDEYGTVFHFRPLESPLPLSRGELIEMINGTTSSMSKKAGLTTQYRELNFTPGDDPEDLRDFVRVSSRFYPELEAYYAQEADEWVRSKLGNRGK